GSCRRRRCPMNAVAIIPLRPGADPGALRALAPVGRAAVSLHTWWRGDGRPSLPRPFGFSAAPTEDRALVAALAGPDRTEVDDGVRAGHRPYVARLRGTPVAYGWSAPNRAAMGELGLEFAIPEGARYLWDFVTLPAWRGLGLYPALLEAILAQ